MKPLTRQQERTLYDTSRTAWRVYGLVLNSSGEKQRQWIEAARKIEGEQLIQTIKEAGHE